MCDHQKIPRGRDWKEDAFCSNNSENVAIEGKLYSRSKYQHSWRARRGWGQKTSCVKCFHQTWKTRNHKKPLHPDSHRSSLQKVFNSGLRQSTELHKIHFWNNSINKQFHKKDLRQRRRVRESEPKPLRQRRVSYSFGRTSLAVVHSASGCHQGYWVLLKCGRWDELAVQESWLNFEECE